MCIPRVLYQVSTGYYCRELDRNQICGDADSYIMSIVISRVAVTPEAIEYDVFILLPVPDSCVKRLLMYPSHFENSCHRQVIDMP